MAKLEDILNTGKSSSGGSKPDELSSWGRTKSSEGKMIYMEPPGKPGGSMRVKQVGSMGTSFSYLVYNAERLPPAACPNSDGFIENPNERYGKKFFNRRDAEKAFESLRNTLTVIEI
jgi:hypothetical protein